MFGQTKFNRRAVVAGRGGTRENESRFIQLNAPPNHFSLIHALRIKYCSVTSQFHGTPCFLLFFGSSSRSFGPLSVLSSLALYIIIFHY